MEVCSVRTRIAEVRENNAENNLKPFTCPQAKMTTFFQDYQFDRGTNRIPIRTSRGSISGSRRACGLVRSGCLLPCFTSKPRDVASGAGGDSYRRGGRKLRARITKDGWRREVHSELLNSKDTEWLMSRRYLGGQIKEIGSWNVASRGWWSPERVHLFGQEVACNLESSCSIWTSLHITHWLTLWLSPNPEWGHF